MLHFTKLIKIVLLVVLIYSIYINATMPTITEGFTGNIRQTVRPRIRKIKSFYIKTNKMIRDKFKNMILKKNR